ncbi:hypothetical protein CRM22_001549, partial [Opisthorchis felineus]
NEWDTYWLIASPPPESTLLSWNEFIQNFCVLLTSQNSKQDFSITTQWADST